MTHPDDKADVALSAYAPDLDEPGKEAADDLTAAAAGSGEAAAQSIALTAERDQLTRAPRDTQRQLVTVEAELRAAKGSATMKLGQAVVAAAKRPWIGGPRPPGPPYPVWRGGGRRGGGPRAAERPGPGPGLPVRQRAPLGQDPGGRGGGRGRRPVPGRLHHPRPGL